MIYLNRFLSEEKESTLGKPGKEMFQVERSTEAKAPRRELGIWKNSRTTIESEVGRE